MGEQIVEVKIGPDGTVEMHVEGMPGMVCLSDTQDLVNLLGGEVETQELTGEAYEEVEEVEQEHLRH